MASERGTERLERGRIFIKKTQAHVAVHSLILKQPQIVVFSFVNLTYF